MSVYSRRVNGNRFEFVADVRSVVDSQDRPPTTMYVWMLSKTREKRVCLQAYYLLDFHLLVRRMHRCVESNSNHINTISRDFSSSLLKIKRVHYSS